MAKHKSKSAKEEVEQVIEQDEVTYEEEVGGEVKSDEVDQPFLQKYRNLLIIAVIAIAGIAIYFYTQRNAVDEENIEALQEMAMAEVFYQQDSIGRALSEQVQFLGFEAVIDQYSGTDAANLARYYAGTGKLKLGEWDAGIGYLEEFEKSDNMLSASAWAALGFAYEQKIDFAGSAEAYEKAAVTPSENDFTTPMYLMDAARNHESAGNADRALEIYQRLRKEFPRYQSVADQTVDKYIYKLGGELDV